jgi:hypothetical protein
VWLGRKQFARAGGFLFWFWEQDIGGFCSFVEKLLANNLFVFMQVLNRFVGVDKIFRFFSAKDFLHEMKTNRAAVKRTKFIPPRLGDSHLGKFYVEYYHVPTKSRSTTSAAK